MSGLVVLVEAYLGVGVLVAVLFLIWGIDQIESDAKGSFAFRPLLAPGLCLLWPLVIWRWWIIVRSGGDFE